MLLRDRLLARLDGDGRRARLQRLAAEVLGIRNAPPELARRLVAQALVLEDRREQWRRIGERICAEAPATAGVYVLRDAAGRCCTSARPINLRRRLRTHFAARRWRGLKARFARAVARRMAGGRLRARGAAARGGAGFASSRPVVNVQVGAPALASRDIPAALVRDVVVDRCRRSRTIRPSSSPPGPTVRLADPADPARRRRSRRPRAAPVAVLLRRRHAAARATRPSAAWRRSSFPGWPAAAPARPASTRAMPATVRQFRELLQVALRGRAAVCRADRCA